MRVRGARQRDSRAARRFVSACGGSLSRGRRVAVEPEAQL